MFLTESSFGRNGNRTFLFLRETIYYIILEGLKIIGITSILFVNVHLQYDNII